MALERVKLKPKYTKISVEIRPFAWQKPKLTALCLTHVAFVLGPLSFTYFMVADYEVRNVQNVA